LNTGLSRAYERFLTELTLDPRGAISDEAGAPRCGDDASEGPPE
jgi:hypothetical protein